MDVATLQRVHNTLMKRTKMIYASFCQHTNPYNEWNQNTAGFVPLCWYSSIEGPEKILEEFEFAYKSLVENFDEMMLKFGVDANMEKEVYKVYEDLNYARLNIDKYKAMVKKDQGRRDENLLKK